MSTPHTRFLPVREGDFDAWLANFSEKISAAPATFGLSAGNAAEIAAAVGAWHAAFVVAVAPSTRTTSTVLAKREQKKAVTAVVRRFAAVIRADETVSRENKLALGLVLRETRPARVNPPESEPCLGLARMDTGVHVLRAANGGEESRRRPRGAAGLVVFRAVAETATNYPDDATYLGLFTRTSFASEFTEADRGKFATYFARWVNAKGEAGPWSKGLSVAIAA